LALLSLALVLWLCWPAHPVQAAGSDIKVLDIREEVNFPGDLTFTLTAQGDQEIVEVRLLYRALDRSIWSYAYPQFSPGRRITARFNLRTVGVGYIPPGTEVEYYYVIRDAEGNVHQTEPAVVEYTDDRFEWERAQVGPLVLLYHDVPESTVNSVTEEVKAQLQRISSLLPVEQDRPLKGVIYNRRSEALDAFPFQSQTISDAHVFGGYAFPPNGVFVGLGFQTRLIVHETAHILLARAIGQDAHNLPAWLDEGFASYAEPGSRPYSVESLRPRGLPLRTMSRVPGTPGAIGVFYRKAESVVAYLIEDYGAERFQQLLGELGQGRATPDALERVYGFDVAGLEDRWARDADGTTAPAPGSPSGTSPFMHLSSWAIGGLALAVMAVLAVRYLFRKLRPAAGGGEGLQPWQGSDSADFSGDFPSDFHR
jgi:hypothetical protein